MTSAAPPRPHVWRTLITLFLVVTTAAIVWANRAKLSSSLTALTRASLPATVLAAGLVFASFMIAAAIYQRLAFKRLGYWQMVLIEMAAAAANRVLPAGLGSLGLHGVFLHKKKHTVAQATATVSINNLLGIAAHLFLLVLVTVFSPASFRTFKTHVAHWQVGWLPYVVLCALLAVVCIPAVRHRLFSFTHNLLVSFRSYTQHPTKVAVAFFLAVGLTATYTAILYVSARAVGVYTGVLACFIVFSLGMLVGTATPTPGGLVGAEAGLFAGFVAYGVPASPALAATLLFRLLTYWLPLVPGGIALVTARKRKLI